MLPQPPPGSLRPGNSGSGALPQETLELLRDASGSGVLPHETLELLRDGSGSGVLPHREGASGSGVLLHLAPVRAGGSGSAVPAQLPAEPARSGGWSDADGGAGVGRAPDPPPAGDSPNGWANAAHGEPRSGVLGWRRGSSLPGPMDMASGGDGADSGSGGETLIGGIGRSGGSGDGGVYAAGGE